MKNEEFVSSRKKPGPLSTEASSKAPKERPELSVEGTPLL